MKTFHVGVRVRVGFALLAFVVGPVTSKANVLDYLLGRSDLETITVTDVTHDGNLVRQPTLEKPLYYAAVSAGYYDLGGIKAGEKPVSRQVVDTTVRKILAKQGYLPALPGQRPDVVLAWSWGTLNVIVSRGLGEVTNRRVNERQLLRFLGGEKLGLISRGGDPFPEYTLQPGLRPLSGDAQNLLDATREDLYVATISAYAVELGATKRAKLLWNTRISAPARGFWLPEAMPAMLAIAAPYVGRETSKPVWIRVSEKFKPEVNLGDTRVVEYLERTSETVVAIGPSN